jgi:DNA-directed RNA polymerase specialized sigma24 family protein
VPVPEDQAFRLFLAGDAETIRGAAKIIASIVRFRRYFIPVDERPDLEQDTMLHLWRAIAAPGFSFRNSFEGLVRAIAYRRCIDWRRQKRTNLPPRSRAARYRRAGGAAPACARKRKSWAGASSRAAAGRAASCSASQRPRV